MNNKKYDLKKVSKVAVATLFLLFLLVDFLAWPQIGSSTSGIVTAFVFEVAVLLALALYGVHMVNREKKGLTTAGGSFIQTLAKYEFLMEQLISRDFKIKYKRSVLGVFWSFLNPLLMMTVQYVVFSKLLGVRDAGVQHYAIYLLCGIVIFNGFNDCCNQAIFIRLQRFCLQASTWCFQWFRFFWLRFSTACLMVCIFAGQFFCCRLHLFL